MSKLCYGDHPVIQAATCKLLYLGCQSASRLLAKTYQLERRYSVEQDLHNLRSSSISVSRHPLSATAVWLLWLPMHSRRRALTVFTSTCSTLESRRRTSGRMPPADHSFKHLENVVLNPVNVGSCSGRYVARLGSSRWLGKVSLRSFPRSIGEERRPDPIERRNRAYM